MLEKDLRKKILSVCKGKNNIMVQPIESGGTGLGIPDLFIRTLNNDCWIELKRFSWPKNSNEIKVPFEPGQFKWIKEFRQIGGTVFLMMLCSRGTNCKKIYCFKNHQIYRQYNLAIEIMSETVLDYNHFDYQRFYTMIDRG